MKDKVRAIFKAYSKTAEDKVDKVNKIKLLELSAEEIIKIGFFTIPILWSSIAAVFKLDFKVINLLNNLIFTTQYTGKPISGFNIGVIFNNLPN